MIFQEPIQIEPYWYELVQVDNSGRELKRETQAVRDRLVDVPSSGRMQGLSLLGQAVTNSWGAISARADLLLGNLSPKLAHENPLVRKAALDSASQLSADALASILPALVGLLEDSSQELREAAVDVLAAVSHGQNCSDDVRSVPAKLAPAYNALCEMGSTELDKHGLQPSAFSPEVVNAMQLLANDASTTGMRLAAMQAIARLDPPSLSQHAELINAVAANAEGEPQVRKVAIEGLGRLPSSALRSYLGTLVTILQDSPNTIVRCAAVKALSKAAPADLANAAEALVGCGLGDSDKNLRLASKQALKQMRPGDLRVVIQRLMKLLVSHTNSDVRLAVLEVLDIVEASVISQPKYVDVLMHVCSLDANALVRSHANATLNKKAMCKEALDTSRGGLSSRMNLTRLANLVGGGETTRRDQNRRAPPRVLQYTNPHEAWGAGRASLEA